MTKNRHYTTIEGMKECRPGKKINRYKETRKNMQQRQ